MTTRHDAIGPASQVKRVHFITRHGQAVVSAQVPRPGTVPRCTEHRRHGLVRWLVGLVAAAAMLSSCSGGSPTRSVAKFCSTYQAEKASFTSRYARLRSGLGSSGGEVLLDLVLGLQSLGDAAVILDKLDRVAPEDIEPDVAAVRDSFRSMQDTMGDEASNFLNPAGLAGAALKGLLSSLESGGSWDHVGQYIQTNCPGGA